MRKWLILIVSVLVVSVLVIAVAVSAQERDEPAAWTPTEAAGTQPSWQEESGVLITGIVADGPAAAAGLRRGDIILAMGGQEVDSPAAVQELVRNMDAGEQVSLSVLRCEQVEEVVVTLGEMDDTGRGYLGVSLFPPVGGEQRFGQSLAGKAESWEQGALVIDVEVDTPAAAAGLQEGDRILALNGIEITRGEPLVELVHAQSVGDKVELTVMRGNIELALNVVLAEHPDEPGVAYLGVRVAPSIVGLRAPDDDVSGLRSGVRVALVDQGSPAEKAGIEPGDLIVAVDGEKVENPQTLIGLIRSYRPGEVVALTVKRNDEETILEVALGRQDDNTGELAYLGVHLMPVMHWHGNLEQLPYGIPFQPDDHRRFDWLPFDPDGRPSESEPHEFMLPEDPRSPSWDSAEA